jgi:hypothetical protein
MIAQKPIFCVVLGDGDQWLLEAEWPDGSIQQICSFKAHSDAVNWISAQSETWLLEVSNSSTARAKKKRPGTDSLPRTGLRRSDAGG